MAANTKGSTLQRIENPDPLLSWEEAAEYLGPSFTARWLRRQVYEFRTLRTVAVGGRRVFARSELDRYITERRAQAEAR